MVYIIINDSIDHTCFFMGSYMNNNWWEQDIDTFTDDELWNHFARALRYMDWQYRYADDSRSFHRGEQMSSYLYYLYDIMKDLDELRAVKMYEDARPN